MKKVVNYEHIWARLFGPAIAKISVWDNGGKSYDRYTLVDHTNNTYFGMSDNPLHPQGFGQSGFDIDMGKLAENSKNISFESLPIACQIAAHNWIINYS